MKIDNNNKHLVNLLHEIMFCAARSEESVSMKRQTRSKTMRANLKWSVNKWSMGTSSALRLFVWGRIMIWDYSSWSYKSIVLQTKLTRELISAPALTKDRRISMLDVSAAMWTHRFPEIEREKKATLDVWLASSRATRAFTKGRGGEGVHEWLNDANGREYPSA